MPSSIQRKVDSDNDAFDLFTTNTNSKTFTIGVDDSDQTYKISTGSNIATNNALTISDTRAISLTGAAASSFSTSSGALTLEGAGGVAIASTGVMTTVKGTLNVDEAVTLDTTLDVTGDTSVTTFDSTGVTSLATGGGVVNIASTGLMTTVKGTLNVDEAVTLDTTLTSTGLVTANGGLTVSGALDINAAATTIDSTTLSIDSTDTTNLTMTANNASDKTMTISALNSGDGTSILALSADNTTLTTQSLTISSSTSEKPLVEIKNTHSDEQNSTLRLTKDSSSPANDDELGVVDFYGDDSAGNSQCYSAITAKSTSVTSDSETGSLTFSVATSTSGALTNVMSIAGGTNALASTVTIEGNLDVKGTTTTINTTNTEIKDKLIELGSGTTGTPSGDMGIIMDRGSSNNAFMGWDETATGFILGTTTASSTSTGNLTITAGDLTLNQLNSTYIEGLKKLTISSSVSENINQSSIAGQSLTLSAINFDDNTTAENGTNNNHISNTFIAAPTLSSTNSITTTNASTLYISAAPIASTNQTITNPYAIYVGSGTTRLDALTCTEQTITSDRTLKTNIETIDNSLEKINKMRGVYFDWKDTVKFNDRKQIGFIAQEVEEVAPELVYEAEKGIKSVNYAQTVSLLLQAMKEQNQIIEDLRKDVEELKKNNKPKRTYKKKSETTQTTETKDEKEIKPKKKSSKKNDE